MATQSNLFKGSGGSNQMTVASIATSAETAAALRALVDDETATKPERVSKFPIALEDFDRLKLSAEIAIAKRGLRSEDADIKAEAAINLTIFDGVAATNLAPPDCQIAVGQNHVLVAVNSAFQVFDKTGKALSTWFQKPSAFYGEALPKGAFVFDPRIVFDHYANRWITIFAATRQTPKGSWIMLSVSQTEDPTGAWWTYALDFTLNGDTLTNSWGDYPTLGFDKQAVYITTNQFEWGKGFAESKLRILNKTEILSGKAAKWFDYWGLQNPDASAAFTIQPCLHYQSDAVSKTSFHLVNTLFPNGESLTLWTLDKPLAFWADQKSVLTTDSMPCKAYSLPPQAIQKTVKNKISTNDVRLLCALSETTGSKTRLLTCHSTGFSWSGDKIGRSAINWYEIDAATKSIVQQNTFGQKGFFYFFPAIHSDSKGNVFLLFARSSEKEGAQLRISSRKAVGETDILEGSKLIRLGESAYKGGRWGDYFGLARDPQDGSAIWFVGEYAAANGKWGTAIGKAQYQVS